MSVTAAATRRTWLGRALWLLAPVAIFIVAVAHVAELSTLREVITTAAPAALILGTLLAAVFAVNQGAMYRGVFGVLGVEVPLGDAVLLSLVMAFASLALPAGVASGIAYFVAAARERGIAASRALLAGLAYYLFDYSALTPVLLAGMAVLRIHRDLGVGSLVALSLFYLAALGAAGLVIWGLLRPQGVPAAIVGAADFVNRLLRRAGRHLPVAAVDEFAAEAQEVLAAVRSRPHRSVRPLVHAVLLQAIAVALLEVVFVALGYRIAPAPLIAGYAVGTVFMVVSVTPSGVGVVEAAMTVTFTSLGVPLEVAAAGAILYRLYTFWLPMLAGFLTLRLMRPARA